MSTRPPSSCPECGAIFFPKDPDAIYCSRSCAQKALLKSRQGNEYRAWKRAVLDRDDWTCQVCGARDPKRWGEPTAEDQVTRRRVFAHHIIELNQAPELKTTVSNGMSVCEVCHAILHGDPPGHTAFNLMGLGAQLWRDKGMRIAGQAIEGRRRRHRN